MVTLAAPAPSVRSPTRKRLRGRHGVTNASRSGSTGAITYKFEIARDSAFGSIIVLANTEGINETGFIPQATCRHASCCSGERWRGRRQQHHELPSSVQSFTALPLSQAATVNSWGSSVARQRRRAPSDATMGDNGKSDAALPPGERQSPDAEMLRIFDLLDRGFDRMDCRLDEHERISHCCPLVSAA